MKSPLSICLFLLMLSCSNQVEKAPTEVVTVESPSEKPRKADYPKGQAAVPEFPGRPYHRVVAFELNGRYGHARAASVFENQTGKQIVLTQPQVEDFLLLLNDRKSYGHYEMACFDPRVGLVFYDESDEVVAYLSLCLACNNVRAEPALDFDLEIPSNSGFTKKVYHRLFELFNAWGIPHELQNSLME